MLPVLRPVGSLVLGRTGLQRHSPIRGPLSHLQFIGALAVRLFGDPLLLGLPLFRLLVARLPDEVSLILRQVAALAVERPSVIAGGGGAADRAGDDVAHGRPLWAPVPP